MVTQNTNANVEAARMIASELGQPTRGKGVDRLAADLGDGPHNHPWLNQLPSVEPSANLTEAERIDLDECVDRYGHNRKVLYGTVELLCARRMTAQWKYDHRKSLSVHATAAQVPEELPLEPFDGVTPADGGGVA